MVIRLHPLAAAELEEAVAHYEDQVPGLGQEFLRETRESLSQIAENPEASPEYDPPYRRYVHPRFPFSVIYRPTDEGVRILAVMHQRRRPDYWKERG